MTDTHIHEYIVQPLLVNHVITNVRQAINAIASACEAAGVSMPSACLSWCLQQRPVQAVIVGARTPEQVKRNAQLATLSQVTTSASLV